MYNNPCFLSINWIVLLVSYDTVEFENEEGSIQEEFWKRFNETHVILDSTTNSEKGFQFFHSMFNQSGVPLLGSLFSRPARESFCNFIVAMESPTYLWMTNDPLGKIHTSSLIMRQGLQTNLIIKGKRRLRGLFEGDMLLMIVSKAATTIDLGPMMNGQHNFAKTVKCMWKSVNYHQPKVERVNVINFKYTVSLLHAEYAFEVGFQSIRIWQN